MRCILRALRCARAAFCARCVLRALRSARAAFCARCVLRARRSARAAFCACGVLRARRSARAARMPHAHCALRAPRACPKVSYPSPLRFLFLLFCHSCAKLFFVLVHHGLRCCVFVGVAHDSGKHARTCFCSWCAAVWRTCIKCLVQHFLHIHALCVSCRSMGNFTK